MLYCVIGGFNCCAMINFLVGVVFSMTLVMARCLPVPAAVLPAGASASPERVGSTAVATVLTADILRHFNVTLEHLQNVSWQVRKRQQLDSNGSYPVIRSAKTPPPPQPNPASAEATVSPQQIINRKK